MATVTLPDELRDTLVRAAKAEGVSSVGEYVQLLAERDREADSPFGELPDEGADRLRARLLALVQEGLDSGPAEVVGPDFWESLRRKANGPRSALPRG